jgi:antitoxin (DNA-binding transcriptional repressor) of toxin-antitoxin stability system
MVYYRTMIKLNINQAKTHLSGYLARLRRGETIVLCKRNTPIAEIRPLPQPRTRKRPIGLAAGEFAIPASFFEPLPADLVAAYAGESESR